MGMDTDAPTYKDIDKNTDIYKDTDMHFDQTTWRDTKIKLWKLFHFEWKNKHVWNLLRKSVLKRWCHI